MLSPESPVATMTFEKSQPRKAKTKIFEGLDEKDEVGRSPNFSYSFGLPSSGRGQDRDNGEAFLKSDATSGTVRRREDEGFDLQRTNFGTSKDDSVGGYLPPLASSSREVSASSAMPGMSEARKLLERLKAL